MAAPNLTKTVAIIPARGGSRGVPGKNLKPVAGRPLLVRTIAAAQASQHCRRVIVSSDDAGILHAARAAGAETVIRPESLSGDIASSESALLHALDQLALTSGLLVFLQCTAPFTRSDDIDGVIAAVNAQQADCGLAVAPFHHFLWQPRPEAPGLVEPLGHSLKHRPRRQEAPLRLIEAGSVYVMDIAGFRHARHRFFGRVAFHAIAAHRLLEIDVPADLAVAEAISPLVENL